MFHPLRKYCKLFSKNQLFNDPSYTSPGVQEKILPNEYVKNESFSPKPNKSKQNIIPVKNT